MGPLLSTEAQKSNFHKRKSSLFVQHELLDDFFGGFWRLLGRLEKEKKEKKKKKKHEKWKNNREKHGKRKRKHEKTINDKMRKRSNDIEKNEK